MMEYDVAEIEKRLWSIAARVRATTTLYDYFSLVLALLFLRTADYRYARATAEVGGEPHATLDKSVCHDMGCVYVPTEASFAYLLSLPVTSNFSDAVSAAMRTLESENDGLRGALPDMRWRIESHAVIDLLNVINSIPLDGAGSRLASVFDSCLHNAAVADSRIEFATPSEVNVMLVRLIKPSGHMTVYDPCAGFGGTLFEAFRYAGSGDGTNSDLRLFGQEVNSESLAICKMRLFLNGIKSVDLRPGSSLSDPQHVIDGQLTTFDRVVCNPPFSLSAWNHGEAERDPYNRYAYGLPPSKNADYAFIEHMIASASPDGAVSVLVPQGVLFRRGSEGLIRRRIVEADLVEAVIGLPAGVLYGTVATAAVLVLNKNKPAGRRGKTLFIDASRDFNRQGKHNCLSADNVTRIVSTFDAFSDADRYARVVGLDEIRKNSFNLNVPRYADLSPVAGLITQYSQYEKCTIKDVAMRIDSVPRGDRFDDKANAVYISVVAGRQAIERIDEIPAGHEWYYQVLLNGKATSGYIVQFLRSSAGQHALATIAEGGAIKRIRRSDLSECMIAVPDVRVQEQIISTHHKLTTLKDALVKLDQELSLNPTGQTEFQTQLDSMLAVVGGLSDADHVRRLIREGESKTLEFKQTFSLCIRRQTKEKDIETSALKTLVAFLNSEGGVLLIGVGDNEVVVGVDVEIGQFHKDSPDNYLKHFKNSLKQRIGEAFYPFIDYRFYGVEGRKVLVADCQPSKSPCYLDGNDFYVRTNPATDKLEGPKFLDYVRHRFDI